MSVGKRGEAWFDVDGEGRCIGWALLGRPERIFGMVSGGEKANFLGMGRNGVEDFEFVVDFLLLSINGNATVWKDLYLVSRTCCNSLDEEVTGGECAVGHFCDVELKGRRRSEKNNVTLTAPRGV